MLSGLDVVAAAVVVVRVVIVSVVVDCAAANVVSIAAVVSVVVSVLVATSKEKGMLKFSSGNKLNSPFGNFCKIAILQNFQVAKVEIVSLVLQQTTESSCSVVWSADVAQWV